MIVVDVLTQMVKWLLDKRIEDRNDTKAAASALRTAACDTELLFSLVEVGVPLDDDKRAKVAHAWATASTEFRTVDREVSDQCFQVSTMLARTRTLDANTLLSIREVLEPLLDLGIRFSLGPMSEP